MQKPSQNPSNYTLLDLTSMDNQDRYFLTQQSINDFLFPNNDKGEMLESYHSVRNPWLSNNFSSGEENYLLVDDPQNPNHALFPNSTTILGSDLSPSLVSASFNLQAFDFLNSSAYGGGMISTSQSLYNGISEDCMSNNSNKINPATTINTATKTKKLDNHESIESGPNTIKRRRSSRSSSCPPLKVRKEKLGGRIAALQKLVAPFGKTDTASVLTETIGYIQFLQDQVHALSMPYMKLSPSSSVPSHWKPCKKTQQSSIKGEESREDLRSRGLCLVPQSYASYFSTYNGGTNAPF